MKIAFFKRASLKARSLLAATITLALFIPLVAFTLEQAFVGSLTQSMRSQLNLQNLMLISEFELEQDSAAMPEALANDGFNLPDSGLYAFINQDQNNLWRSLSSLQMPPMPQLAIPETGQESFVEINIQQQAFFSYSYTAEFQSSQGFTPVTFHILQDQQAFKLEVETFRHTLWQWLGLISLLLFALLLFSLLTALRPIKHLIDQIRQVEQGKISNLQHTYPQELEKLKLNINHLLDVEQQQRLRYKNSLGDLAHSLKTPLAVLNGTPNMPGEAREPILQLDNIIQRQLKRAVLQHQDLWQQAEAIEPIINKLFNAMQKVYADKQLDFSYKCASDTGFYGDKTDLLELLGNLLDNACKAANSQVAVFTAVTTQQLIIQIDDDGPGIPPEAQQQLLKRGKRLDSYQSGQGIGMAVVSDLVAAYNGQLLIADSPLGGARIELRFRHK